MSFQTLLRGASLCALAFFLSPLAAHADEGADKSIIVTARQMTQDAATRIARTPGGVDVVSAEDFHDRLAVSLRDTLAFSPGVYAQPRFGQEVRLSIRGSGISRGFHMRGITLLQDGIPINWADDNGDFQELDPQVFQHIEVYRGGNALRLGGSTLGGAINAVTPTGRTAPGIGLSVDGGAFDTIRAKAEGGYADDRADAWAAITADRSDGDRDHARRKSLRFNGNVGLRLSDRVETRFYASAQGIRQLLPGALSEADALAHPKTGNFAGDQARDIDSLRLQNRTVLDLGAGQLSAGIFLNLKRLFHPIFQVVDQQSTDYGVFGRYEVQAGPVGLTLGTTARFGETQSRRFLNLNGDRQPGAAPTLVAEQRAHTINAYGEVRYAPVDRLTLIAGGVYTDAHRVQEQTVPAIVRGQVDYEAFAPKAGLLFAPSRAMQFYANYSRSVEMPGFGEVAQVAAFVPVRPQRAWTAELGTRGHTGIAAWDISLYRADLKGEMLQYTVSVDIPAATFNAGRTRHQGVEAGLDLTLAPWLMLRSVYQYSDFRFRDDRQYGDNRLPVVPRHMARAQLRIGGEALSVTPSVEWVPQGAFVDYANSKRVGGYALLGLGAQAQVRKGVTMFVDARNIANEKAVGDISAVVNYAVLAPAARAIVYPVERRAVYGGVRARF
jgi:iron complex outermembrane receptor protein